MTAIALGAQPVIATRTLAGVSIPDTPVITRAIEFAREKSEPYLFNHVMRSWLFAALFAQRKQAVHDAEVLAVTTILHDIGLTESFDHYDLKWKARMPHAPLHAMRVWMIVEVS